MAVVNDALYFTSRDPAPDEHPNAAVMYRVDLSDPPSTAVPHAAIDGESGLLGGDETWLWVTNILDGRVQVFPTAPPADGTLHAPDWSQEGLGSPNVVLAQPNAALVGLYQEDGAILRIAKGAAGTTNEAPRVVASGQDRVADMTIGDLDRVYWANYGSGEVRSASGSGGGMRLHAQGQPEANGVAVGGGWVFFTCYAERAAGGSVRRAPVTQSLD
jgi:hypothetical protein